MNITGITREAIGKLTQYEWPGNIRDLENAVQSAMILAQDGIIDTDHLPMRIKGYPSSIEAVLMNENETNKIKEANAIAEKKLIEATLQQYNYNRTIVAKALNISRKTLFNKMKKYGL